jgi:hypothetical protein
MLTSRKIALILLLLASSGSIPQTQAQTVDLAELGIQAAAGASGYLIGKAFHSNAGAAAGAGLGPVLAEMGYNAFKNKTNRDRLDSFMAGQDYQRWVMSTKHWYDLTLDPNTGFSEAFSGLDYGPTPRGKPARPNQIQGQSQGPLPEFIKKEDGSDQLQDITPYNPVIVGEGTYNGVFRTKRVLWFPTLN